MALKFLLGDKLVPMRLEASIKFILNTWNHWVLGHFKRKFEQLKEKLNSEGLFKPDRKRPIPLRPKGIALVTSETGAAVQDMLNVLSRRCPSIPVFLISTQVQGAQAAGHIILALEKAYRLTSLVDVIILGRGGGSIEDMWCFNDEALARKIAESPIPTISAVGHEIDFTISDFVADLRAPTPSAAAELVATSDLDISLKFKNYRQTIIVHFQKQLSLYRERILQFSSRIVDPQKRLRDLLFRQDELFERLNASFSNNLRTRSLKVSFCFSQLLGFKKNFLPLNERVKSKASQLSFAMDSKLHSSKMNFASKVALLDSLNPLSVLKRGYSYQTLIDNKIFHSVSDVEVGTNIISVLKDGKLTSTVTFIQSEPTKES
jgi:exodeoxyribonuclease VII large subunit